MRVEIGDRTLFLMTVALRKQQREKVSKAERENRCCGSKSVHERESIEGDMSERSHGREKRSDRKRVRETALLWREDEEVRRKTKSNIS